MKLSLTASKSMLGVRLKRSDPWSASLCEDSGLTSELVVRSGTMLLWPNWWKRPQSNKLDCWKKPRCLVLYRMVLLGKNAGKNQKPGKTGSTSKPNTTGRSACLTCGTMHSDVCRAATGACHRCGSMDHKVRDCPEEDLRPKSQGKSAGDRVCYNCGEAEHYKNQCPNDAQQTGKRASDGPHPAAKRQAIMPRFYTTEDETMDPSTSCPITGEMSYLSSFP